MTDDRLIFLIFTAQNKLRTYLNNALAAAGVRVSYAQAGIIFLLKQGSIGTMSDLSRLIGVDNSTLTGLVDRLEKAGFVARQASSTDRRSLSVRITPEGIAEGEKAKAIIRGVNAEVKEGFSPEELESFKGVLRSFFDKFDKQEGRT
ncbi:MAG TPA: MarR family transcriptional regulator [Syntrophales bacterium]|jgi:DNA-binding MarR family transcriptional regulator|nr:MarR family transcriptional regulator [Syntrophales bacterium]HPX80803.1 MarR family transcriptional regulator [Syntrophales bacterium]